jgi:hypothetical protein
VTIYDEIERDRLNPSINSDDEVIHRIGLYLTKVTRIWNNDNGMFRRRMLRLAVMAINYIHQYEKHSTQEAKP